MSSQWIRNAQLKIYTIVTTRAKKNLSGYTDLYFTEESVSDSATTHFPTVYIHFIPSSSIGNTFEPGINGFVCGVQIDVVVSKTKKQGVSDAYKIINDVLDQFGELGFNDVSSIPEEIKTQDTDTKRVTARIRRNIGHNDIL